MPVDPATLTPEYFREQGKKGGRPRNDGLKRGSPEAIAADEARKIRVREPNTASLPGPDVPPRSKVPPVQPASATAPAAPGVGGTALPTPERKLPEDPTSRAIALEPFKMEAVQLVGMLDGIASRYLPPPLTDPEQAMLCAPLSEVLWKYNGHLPCEIMLAVACLTVFGPRVATAVKKRKELAKKDMPAQKAA